MRNADSKTSFSDLVTKHKIPLSLAIGFCKVRITLREPDHVVGRNFYTHIFLFKNGKDKTIIVTNSKGSFLYENGLILYKRQKQVFFALKWRLGALYYSFFIRIR